MRFSTVASASVLAAVLAQGQRTANRTSRQAAVVPNKFIIELKNPEDLAKRSTDDGQGAVDKLFSDLSELNVTTSSALNYTSDVFVGASVTLESKADVKVIETLPQIAKIWPVFTVYVPEPINAKVVPSPPENYNVHIATGVQKLHNEGIYGAGVTIAIVDTGVDYTHPDLGGGFGPGYKVEGGYDFVGDVFNVDKPDNDPFNKCGGHGTHVSGIIGANSTRFMGVGPAAKLRVYKVAHCDEGMGIDVLIAAHIKAYKDGADIISTSIGDESNWPSSPWPVASNKIAQKGIFVISSAGNSGSNGPFLASTEAAGEEVISVAATRAGNLPAQEAIIADSKGNEFKIAYLTEGNRAWEEYWPTKNVFTPLRTGVKLWSPHSPENTNPNNPEGCEYLKYPKNTVELAGRVVLVRRSSGCTYREMGLGTVSRGARFMLIINNGSAPMIPIFGGEDPWVQPGMVTEEAGNEIERRLINNETLTIRFPNDTVTLGVPLGSLTGTVDYYSSWGLANDLSIKPDIAAPGSDIYSTWPVSDGSYFLASGTSMATPYITGVVALYLSANGGGRSKKGKSELRDIARSLVNSGIPASWVDVNSNLDTTTLAPVAQQGGGFIDAYKFVHSKVFFSPNKLALKHLGNLESKFKITVSNTGSSTIRLNVTHRPAGSFYTYGAEDHLSIATEFPDTIMKDKVATAKFGTELLEVKPNSKKSIEVEFIPPTGFENDRVPIYGGYVAFGDLDSGDIFTVPYSGMAMDGSEIYEPTSQGGVFWLASTFEDITAPLSIKLAEDSLVAEFDLHYGVKEARLELILNSTYSGADSLTISGVPGSNGFVGAVAANYDLGRTTAYKNPERLWPGTQFLNATVIPPGTYRYVLRILKPFREGNSVGDWSFTVSPPIEVLA